MFICVQDIQNDISRTCFYYSKSWHRQKILLFGGKKKTTGQQEIVYPAI